MDKMLSFRIEKIGAINNNKIKQHINHDYRLGFIPKYIQKHLTHKNYNIYGHKFNVEQIIELQNTRSKRKIQKNVERFFSGILTFGEIMSEDYANNPKLFDSCSKDFIEKLQNKLGVKILSAVVHLDEKTPHIHFLFDNINNEGKSIKRNIKPNDCSDFQDLGGSCFERMGYERGIKGSKNKHLNVYDLHKLQDKREKLQRDCIIFNKFVTKQQLTPQEEHILNNVIFIKQSKQALKNNSNNLLDKVDNWKNNKRTHTM